MKILSNRPKKRFKVLIIISFILVLILCLGGYFYSYLLNFSKPSTSNEETINTAEVKDDGIVNILVSGVDIGEPKVKLSDDKKRTDTIILINYNPKTGAMNVVSIPRDTMVKIDGKTEKINAANIMGGQSALIKSVEGLLGIDINYYGRINYEGFRKLIDAIGGIDMPITTTMNYDDAAQNLHIHFKKGTTVHLDGEKAEEFFRWRKNNNGTGLADGDLGRIENQHLFIEKVMEKVKTPQIIVKIPAIMEIVPKYVTTNMKPDEILKYTYNFTKVDKANIKMSTLKGTTPTIGGVSYFVFSDKENAELISVLKGEAASTDTNKPAAQLNRTTVKVQVLNGTNKSGLASSYATQLKKSGYMNIATGNGTKATKSKIILNGVDATLVSTIKSEFKIENIETNQQKDANFDIMVLLGDDYKSSSN